MIYKIPGQMDTMNFQDEKGTAKGYQVRQLLKTIEDLQLEQVGGDDVDEDPGEQDDNYSGDHGTD